MGLLLSPPLSRRPAQPAAGGAAPRLGLEEAETWAVLECTLVVCPPWSSPCSTWAWPIHLRALLPSVGTQLTSTGVSSQGPKGWVLKQTSGKIA